MSKPHETSVKVASDEAVAFGKLIAARRKSAKLSQEQLAERVETNRVYVSELERGVKEACLGMILRIAKALQMTASSLLEGLEDKP